MADACLTRMRDSLYVPKNTLYLISVLIQRKYWQCIMAKSVCIQKQTHFGLCPSLSKNQLHHHWSLPREKNVFSWSLSLTQNKNQCSWSLSLSRNTYITTYIYLTNKQNILWLNSFWINSEFGQNRGGALSTDFWVFSEYYSVLNPALGPLCAQNTRFTSLLPFQQCQHFDWATVCAVSWKSG